METPSFKELGLSDEILAAIEVLGYEKPSPIQALAIPPALEGTDLIGLSQTGSGKTAAFTLPVLQKIDLSLSKTQCLIICPTRELCMQVCDEVHRLGSKMRGLRAVPVYGGAPIDRQIRALRQGTHIVVGTPGRLLDHLRRRTFPTENIKCIVLDEADRMLDMGFKDDMEDLLKDMPKDRQTSFFSATMNPQVEKLTRRYSTDPQSIEVERKALTVDSVDQCYYEVRRRSKLEVLSRLLDMEPPRLAIVFCSTKRMVDECTEALIGRGYSADRLHGDISQNLRERVLKRFRDGQVEILVATDVAARGLDVDDIDIVFNFDIPYDPEDYVHRIGRTGRAGRSGRAISFVFGREIYRLQTIERFIRQKIERRRIPSQEQVEGKRADLLFDTVKERLEGGDFKSYEDLVQRLLDQDHSATDIAGALFTLLKEAQGNREGQFIEEDRPERPHRERRERSERPERGRRAEERRKAEREEGGGDRDRPRADRERKPRDRSEGPSNFRNEPQAEGGKATLFLSLGKKAGMKPGDIAGMCYREAGIPNGTLGRIKIHDDHSIIEVNHDVVDELLMKTRKSRLGGRTFKLGHDRGEGGGDGDSDSREDRGDRGGREDRGGRGNREDRGGGRSEGWRDRGDRGDRGGRGGGGGRGGDRRR
ncbi:MAG: DEAD/DEAH box helicase [Verrucomicrobiota bacterium]